MLSSCWLLPDIWAFFKSNEGQREFEKWKNRQSDEEEKDHPRGND